MFPEDRAELVIQGQDADAKKLFEAMNVKATTDAGWLVKEIIVLSSYRGSSQEAFSLGCKYSATSKAASCFLKVYPTVEAGIMKELGFFFVAFNGAEASLISKSFNFKEISRYESVAFQSIDGKFAIWKMMNNDRISNFIMEYRDSLPGTISTF
jgi:hypothetical protein